jgi:ABC-2 type transport system permease protein
MLLVPGLLLVRGLDIGSPRACLTLAWVLLLGLVATQSIGAMLGSLISTPRGAGYLSIPVLGLVAISGIFYPVTSMPPWLQWTAQVFPMYWLGLACGRPCCRPARSAPRSAIPGGTWTPPACPGAWAVIGLVLAPAVLRRMARRESGSSVAGRREKARQRIG